MAIPQTDPFSAVLSGGLQGLQGGQAGPSSAGNQGKAGGASFDSSGMNVNFGSGGITSSRAGEMSDTMKYVLIGAAFLIAWKLLKKKSS